MKEPLDCGTPLKYIERTVMFVEVPGFAEVLHEHLDDEQYRELQEFLAANPTAGDLIVKGRGLRKLRWVAEGRGKRGGVRVIYYWAINKKTIAMLDLFAKNEADDLTPTQLKILANYVRSHYK